MQLNILDGCSQAATCGYRTGYSGNRLQPDHDRVALRLRP